VSGGGTALVIAIDGPAGSGKSTLARRLAGHFGLRFLDTGLLYRAVARRMLDGHEDPNDAAAAEAAARALAPGEVEESRLRGEGVGEAASVVAAHPGVRSALLPFQRGFAARPPGAVLAGRDIASVVCPDATIKLFITADAAERARRRYEELRRRGETPIYERVLEELRERDRRDEGRAVAPARVDASAEVVDTTRLDAEEAFEKVRGFVAARIGVTAAQPDQDQEP